MNVILRLLAWFFGLAPGLIAGGGHLQQALGGKATFGRHAEFIFRAILCIFVFVFFRGVRGGPGFSSWGGHLQQALRHADFFGSPDYFTFF